MRRYRTARPRGGVAGAAGRAPARRVGAAIAQRKRGRASPTVTVGSEGFDESQLAGRDVRPGAGGERIYRRHATEFASRKLALPAFDSGDVNLLPEYIGSLLRELQTAPGPHEGEATGDTDETLDSPGGDSR